MKVELEKAIESFCVDEITDHQVYQYLSNIEGNESIRRILEKLASDEKRHYEFWKKLLGRECKPRRIAGALYRYIYRVLGPVFALNLLERGEEERIEEYREFLKKLEGEAERKELEAIIHDEVEHEHKLVESIEDVRVKYMGYIALGLADAIVEVTGVHAGFLGATASTLAAGVAGLVVGFSAALSMAGAAYLQAKHSRGEESPLFSALITGVSYIFTVALLAVPYFVYRDMVIAFTASLLVAILLTAFFTYYSTIVQKQRFLKELVTSVVLLLGTALGAYIFGDLIGRITGVREVIG